MRINSLACLAGIWTGGVEANAQWTVTNLHPQGASASYAYSVNADQQVGTVWFDSLSHASVWSGSSQSWGSLNPPVCTGAEISSVTSGIQGGTTTIVNTSLATLWNGSAATWRVINPIGAAGSRINGAFGTEQVGIVHIANVQRAALWHGSAESWVDLHPPVATSSTASGTSGTQQVGWARINQQTRASLWNGTGASWTNLDPGVTGLDSYAVAVHGGQQVGYLSGSFGGGDRAAMWRGTAASRVSLHPANATNSVAYGVHDGQQVGFAQVAGVNRACLWNGTADSYLDLHQFAPFEFGWTIARSIWHTPSRTFVVGFGLNLITQRTEALLWSRPPCFTIARISDQFTCNGGRVSLTATVDQPGTFTYRWRLNGVPIALNSTAIRSTLVIPRMAWSHVGDYDCIVTNDCDSIVSNIARVFICASDFNCDSFIDFFDYGDFVSDFATGESRADFNGDGFIDFFDYGAFVEAFEAGC
jgi:hypothetical protein